MAIEFGGIAPLLEVFDLPASIRFYRDVLGFEVLQMAPAGGWAGLRRGGVELMLNTAYEEDERPAAPDAARVAAHHDTCLYFGCRDLDAAWRHLREHGIDAREPAVAPYGMRQLYCRDPDGYGLCFQWPASEETSRAWRQRYGIEV